MAVAVSEGSGNAWPNVGNGSNVVVGVGVSVAPCVYVGVGPVGVVLGVLVELGRGVGEYVTDWAGVLVSVLPGVAVSVGADVLSGVGVCVDVGVLVIVISIVD